MTWFGNLLAFRCVFLCWVARTYNRPNLLEQPFLSKMAWLSMWKLLLQKGFIETAIASCMFGSPQKKFRLLSYGLDRQQLSVPCNGRHQHLRIEGKFTKPSAVYVPRLARMTRSFLSALAPCTESVVLNDLLLTGDWKVDLQWFWATKSHINIRVACLPGSPSLSCEKWW